MLRDFREVSAGMALDTAYGPFGCDRGFMTMTKPVDHRHQISAWDRHHEVPVAGLALPRQDERCGSGFDGIAYYRSHFLAVTVVPFSAPVSI